MEQLAAEGFGLPLKVSSRDRNAASPPACCEIWLKGPIDVVADADAEDARIARSRLDEVQKFGLVRRLG